ncbi:adenylyltransferase/cytidyltransferase family protein [Sphingobacterium siyangense]|uniref:adenylyltransferase/cytidyltransferase family protein n=1 Tax=Sphingobacterium TaxID=28453 RepID=UPI00200D329D|nr:adenylyltransferase/cytidyltransferase family protein [Sphingobacterium siyangense]UQA77567.1 adenylyltransferase/cytidyltransferase family protein [Sphingobacterium siyangense]
MYNTGYISGVFDLFHKGHKEFLKKCVDNCEILFCGVESDTRVRESKGANRPSQSENKRILNIKKHLRNSDRVFLKNKPSFYFLSEIKPDVIFTTNGTNKSHKTLEYVRKKNVLIIMFNYNNQISTTKILLKKYKR